MGKDSQKLNIAMLGHKRIPSREGGIEIVVEELAARMVEEGHTVTCYNRRGHHVSGRKYDGQDLKKYKGILLKYVPTIDCRGLAAVTSSFAGAVCASFGKYDVVHFHAEGPAFMCWLPKLFGKRTVVTVHGLDHRRAKWGRAAKAYIMMGERNAAKFADEIIVLSESTRDYFRDIYHRETAFIPNGVSRPWARKADLIKRRFGLEKNGYILFLGRIVPEKGLRCLIDAFKGIRTDKKLVIAGGSSDTDSFMNELKRQASRDRRIIFTGFVQGGELGELYSNAYMYILPSNVEGMPLSLLEAMSYGNCCLVSDIRECSEVVEDKAVLFKAGNAGDLRHKIQMLCDDPGAVERYKADAADFICHKYSWDDVVKKTIGLYKRGTGV